MQGLADVLGVGVGAPVDTTMVTLLPGVETTPAWGSCEITVPAATVVLSACVTTAVKPAPVSCAWAAACELPTTSGTATGVAVGEGAPATSRSTAEPSSTCLPAAGDWSTTVPSGPSVLCTRVILPVVRPSASSAAVALAVVIPVTSGTLTPPLSKAPSAQARASAARAAMTTSRIQSHALLGRLSSTTSCTWAERSTRSMSAWYWAAEPRVPGSFSRERITICASAGGTSGLSSCGGRTTPSSCSWATMLPSVPSNAWRPVSSR